MNRLRKGRGGQTIFLILSLLVAVSMICGLVLAVMPGPQRRVQPTATPVLAPPILTPTIPTLTPTPVVGPSPLPQPTP